MVCWIRFCERQPYDKIYVDCFTDNEVVLLSQALPKLKASKNLKLNISVGL